MTSNQSSSINSGGHGKYKPPAARMMAPVPAFSGTSTENARSAMDGTVNILTGRPLSARYKTILTGRKLLPVYSRMQEFYDIYDKHQIVVIIGETGSGKTTQIPQFCLYSTLLGRNEDRKMVACTQPRRVAAMSIAQRVAEELDVSLGKQVGYNIRFENVTEPGTTVLKYMTDGILLREAMNDPLLSHYSTVILDEAHERTLATDVLMSLVKKISTQRNDLKVVIMSATLDALKFQSYFGTEADGPAPLLKVSGRTFPVETYFMEETVTDYVKASIRVVLQIHLTEAPGDILLFLTGEAEIEEACRTIRFEVEDRAYQQPTSIGPLLCIPLYSSLPLAAQQRIFEPAPLPLRRGGPPGRKVIVSTNIAETSLTIDGIVYVVDPGFVKNKVYNPRLRLEALLVNPISRASAQQRAGRAGRTRPGKCYRLYKREDFQKQLEEQTPPEILRSNLASTVLELMKLGVRDLVRFDYMDAPAPETVMRALELLKNLGALDDMGNLTELGKTMSQFPLDPQMAKMLVVSPALNCSNEVLTLVAMLSVLPVFVGQHSRKNEVVQAKKGLSIGNGDHLTLVHIYNLYLQNKHSRDWASKNYLSHRALQQAENVRRQVQKLMERFHIPLVSTPNYQDLQINFRKALAQSYFMQVAHRVDEKIYVTVKDEQTVDLHHSSDLDTSPDWVVFDEFQLTTKPHIKTVTEVEPEWLLEHAGHYFDPETFPEGNTKQELKRILANMKSKPRMQANGNCEDRPA